MKPQRKQTLGRNLPPQPVLQHFWDLAALDEPTRLKAAHALMAHLLPLHQSFVTASPSGDAAEEADDLSEDQLYSVLHPHVAYTFTRLVKGLPSSRLAARQGFTLALSLLIRLAYPVIQWKHIQAALQRHILAAVSDSNMDEREKLYGRMFVVVACIESGLPSVVASAQDVEQMTDHLMQVADKKAFLREAAYAAVFKLVATVSEQNKPAVLATIATYLPQELAHIDHLTLSLFLDLHGVPNLPHTDLLTSAPVHDLLLHAASVAPRLHLVWAVLVAKLLGLSSPVDISSSVPRLPTTATLPLLGPIWATIDHTFLASSLPQRQAAALAVFAALVRAVPAHELPALFTPHLIKVLDQAAALGDGNLLTPHAKRAMHAVAEVAVVDPHVVPVVLSAVKPSTVAALLQQHPSSPKTDADDQAEEESSTTAASPVDQLLARLTDKDVDAFVATLVTRAEQAVTNSAATDTSSTALDALLNGSLLARASSRTAIARFLLSPAHRAHHPTQAAARILTFLTRAFPAPETPSSSAALARVYAEFPERHPKLAAWVAQGAPKDKHEAAVRALAMAGHLVMGTDADVQSGMAVRAAQLVEEVMGVWERLHPAAKKKKKGKRTVDSEEQEQLHPLDVLADVALELTAHPMAWLRRVCAQVVGVFAEQMTENTLELMVTALQGETGEEEEEEDDDDEMDVDDASEDESDEEVDGVDDGDDEDAMDVEDSADSDQDESDNDADDRNAQLSAAITNALRASGIAAKASSDAEDDESDLDDDQMLALDNVLGALVRKQNSRSATTDRLHFQYRVADLIGTYLKHRTSGATLVHLRLLADEIAETQDKQLAGKLWSALGNVKKIDVSGAEEGELDAITLMFLKGDLAAAHGVLMKLFKAHPPSAEVVQVLLSDLKRFKSVLAGLAKTLPGMCGPILVAVVGRLSRKSAKQLEPVVLPLFERVPGTPELGTALAEVQGKLADVLVAEITGNVKDTTLLKIGVAAVRAWVKAGLDAQVWQAAVVNKISESQMPTKQAPAALFREVIKLVSSPSPPAATTTAVPPTPRASAPTAAAAKPKATPSGADMETPRPPKKASGAATAAAKAQSAAVAKKLARTPDLKHQEPLPGTLVPTPGTLTTPGGASAAAATPKASKQGKKKGAAIANTPASAAKATPSRAKKVTGNPASSQESESVAGDHAQASSCVIA